MIFDLRRFAFDLGISQGEIAEILGVQQPVISNMITGSRKFRMEHLAALRDKYGATVDSYIVDNSVAKVFTEAQPQQITATIIPANIVDEIKEEATNAVAIEQPPIIPDRIVRNPEVNVMEWLDNGDGEHSQNAFNIASIMRRTKFVIQMNNNAMSPTLYQNEYVFLKPFAKDSEIIDGEIYGIETKARGILIRFLYDGGDYIITRPKNTLEYGEIKILKKDIINKYHIVFHGSTHLSSLPDNEAERTKRITQQGEHINSLMGELCKAGDRIDTVLQQNTELIRTLIEKH